MEERIVHYKKETTCCGEDCTYYRECRFLDKIVRVFEIHTIKNSNHIEIDTYEYKEFQMDEKWKEITADEFVDVLATRIAKHYGQTPTREKKQTIRKKL